MPSNHLILCRPLFLLPSIFPSIRIFSNESALRIRWPKYWSFSFNISPSSEHPGLISFRMDWLDVFAVQGTVKSLLWGHESVGYNWVTDTPTKPWPQLGLHSTWRKVFSIQSQQQREGRAASIGWALRPVWALSILLLASSELRFREAVTLPRSQPGSRLLTGHLQYMSRPLPVTAPNLFQQRRGGQPSRLIGCEEGEPRRPCESQLGLNRVYELCPVTQGVRPICYRLNCAPSPACTHTHTYTHPHQFIGWNLNPQYLQRWPYLETRLYWERVGSCSNMKVVPLLSRVWLWPCGLQHVRLPCTSLSPGACSNSCPLSQWCHPTFSSYTAPFSCLQSFLASGFFPMSWLFTSFQFSSVQSLSRILLFETPWTAAHQASLSIQYFGHHSSHQVAKLLEFQLQHQSFQWIFRTDFL